MAAIHDRGRLIVGVDQNTFMFGYRDPFTGELEGFDIDLAREIARRIFGDPDRIDLRVVEAGQRESALESGQVDLVVRTFSITCERKQNIDFSTTYFYANQKILAHKGSDIRSAADLSGKRVCAVSGTTSLKRVFDLEPRPTLVGVTSWTDCLLMMQQGQIDAISTDDVVLKGLARQDPDVDVVGESLGIEPYGVGSTRTTTTSSDSSTVPSPRSATTAPGNASTTGGFAASGHRLGRPSRGIRTDDDPEPRRAVDETG